jgi:hypothetical protein
MFEDLSFAFTAVAAQIVIGASRAFQIGFVRGNYLVVFCLANG